MGQRPQRRQERQNFFPSFSDSFFDPFTSEDPHSDSYYGIPNTYKQAPHRQQYQPQRAGQHQPVDEYQDDDEVEQTQYRPEHRTQYRQRPQQKQQQRPNQQPQSHAASRRRSRRHRKRDTQDPQDLQTPVSHIHPQASNAQADEMESLVQAAFGDEEESARIKSEPKNEVRESRPYEEDSLEQDEQEEEESGESGESGESEGEQTLPDRELQQKSSAELEQIESSLEGLSNELDQIISGEITKKKQILFTEENLTKAMLKIDAVESGGDPSIRQKRKDLINQAEGLLEKVDEFKRLTNTSATN
ncbi:hypothetical protein BGZ80_008791 [Entomortierella chlamydospora]|uniref:BAG domain-containing protein n=1 Tax=Entomortierella chlamydospora TaxID=101097 RepID=A0A9P6N3T7_9FUNG|nr:hypothetical protein BGZ79_006802 [Entomortierella chlamydospora]KAG0023619.1 hypothetical protein BGZ80_008791 [Entomortierella chlamydospora]